MMPMPQPNAATISRRETIAAHLRELVADPAAVITTPNELKAYETDAMTAYTQVPIVVVLPETTEEIARVLRYCNDNGIKVVPRGAGTSLVGGSLPLADSVVMGLAKLTQVLDIDYDNRTATVQAGVTNLAITNAVQGNGFFYAPDPSSQLACSIGGNVAMNSGGAHCLKYGVTSNAILGLKAVTITGEILEVGGRGMDAGGINLLGALIGTEGQLVVVTEVTVRILRSPEGARPMLLGFASESEAGACVDTIIASGLIPVAIEFMDKPAIKVCEGFAKAGYPLDVEAMLIVEVEGNDEELTYQLEKIRELAARHDANPVRIAQSTFETALIWKGRKSAFGAMGRISDYICMDGVIPTGRLSEALQRVAQMARERGYTVANIFHAGDGNLHPLIAFDANDPESLAGAEKLGGDILKLCVEMGGCLTGEHGVGVEKRDLLPAQFRGHEIEQQRRIKDVFDPQWLLNPGKVFPLADRDGVNAQAAE